MITTQRSKLTTLITLYFRIISWLHFTFLSISVFFKYSCCMYYVKVWRNRTYQKPGEKLQKCPSIWLTFGTAFHFDFILFCFPLTVKVRQMPIFIIKFFCTKIALLVGKIPPNDKGKLPIWENHKTLARKSEKLNNFWKLYEANYTNSLLSAMKQLTKCDVE